MTTTQLLQIAPVSKSAIAKYLYYLNVGMEQYEITCPLRQPAFIAQLLHESLRFIYVKEIASGKAYEGREDLGNTQKGDGVRFKGRGLIQITGRNNYTQVSNVLGVDFVSNPELLETPLWATRSACWFWYSRGLNALADKKQFLTITRRINGGTNGYAERLAYYNKALKVCK